MCVNGFRPIPSERIIKEYSSVWKYVEARVSAVLTVFDQETPVSSESLLSTHTFSKAPARSPFMNHQCPHICGKTIPRCLLTCKLGSRVGTVLFFHLGACSVTYSCLKRTGFWACVPSSTNGEQGGKITDRTLSSRVQDGMHNNVSTQLMTSWDLNCPSWINPTTSTTSFWFSVCFFQEARLKESPEVFLEKLGAVSSRSVWRLPFHSWHKIPNQYTEWRRLSWKSYNL